MALTAPLEGTRKELEDFLQAQPETQRFRLMPLPTYPDEVIAAYRSLTAKRRRGQLTLEEADELEGVKAQINAIDAMRPFPDIYEQQSEALHREMEEIRQLIRSHAASSNS